MNWKSCIYQIVYLIKFYLNKALNSLRSDEEASKVDELLRLEEVLLSVNHLGYNPLFNNPINFCLTLLDNRSYMHLMNECIKILHHYIDRILKKVKIIGYLNYSDESGTWLHKAIRHKNHEAIECLLELAINPNVIIRGKTPLMMTVLDNDLTTAEILLKSGKVNPNYYGLCCDQALYKIAKSDKYLPMAKLLIKYGANVDGHHIEHPFRKAVEHEQKGMQDLLISHGCKTDFSDEPTFMAYQVTY